MSVFAPSKNNAVARLEHLLDHGTDPGQVPSAGGAGSKPAVSAAKDAAEAVDEPELATNIEEVAYDRITARISEDFAGHNLATLVTAILETDGLKCTQSPPGPDGGIDIIAGRGVLGLDNPILVQVKSGAQVGSPVVNQLQGVMAAHGAEQGLLVAWGGLTRQAQERYRTTNSVSASGRPPTWWTRSSPTTSDSRGDPDRTAAQASMGASGHLILVVMAEHGCLSRVAAAERGASWAC